MLEALRAESRGRTWEKQKEYSGKNVPARPESPTSRTWITGKRRTAHHWEIPTATVGNGMTNHLGRESFVSSVEWKRSVVDSEVECCQKIKALIFLSNLSLSLGVYEAVYTSASLAQLARIWPMAKHAGISERDFSATLDVFRVCASNRDLLARHPVGE
ncbi:hypothetical protein QYF36_000248 [Acer negundo]|nr:hypothetical protein QYF36_000248 [Acer negundo]